MAFSTTSEMYYILTTHMFEYAFAIGLLVIPLIMLLKVFKKI